MFMAECCGKLLPIYEALEGETNTCKTCIHGKKRNVLSDIACTRNWEGNDGTFCKYREEEKDERVLNSIKGNDKV